MEKLYLYKVDSAYLKKMRKIDHRINVKFNNRPFVGIITMVNGNDYVIPLTSQTTAERKKHGKGKRSAKITTFIRSSSGEEIANLLYNNMFPVKPGVYTALQINPITDTYESNEIRYIRKHELEIKKKAQKVYNSRTGTPDNFLIKVCCDFKKIENSI